MFSLYQQNLFNWIGGDFQICRRCR